MIGATEVAEQLGVSTGYAYRLVRILNTELQEQGFLTVPGKVSRQYFECRYFNNASEEAESK